MKEVLLQTYMVALPIFLTYIVWLLKHQKTDRDANSKGTMLLLRVQLIEYHEKWTERGFATKHGLENFIENKPTTTLGESVVTRLLPRLQKLPIQLF